MNKKQCTVICIFLCLCLLAALPIPAFADEIDTLRICSAADFLAFAENCRLDTYSKDLTVRLEADIDLSGIDFTCIPIFSGYFDGNGHTIHGMNITADGSVQGLFRYLTDTAVVQNLNVDGAVTPQGSRSVVGGIAGRNAGHIQNCTFTGIVTASDTTGGLVGINALTGILDGCSVKGTVIGNHFAGGIAGENAGVIRNCVNHAQINTSAQQNSVDIFDVTMDTLTNAEAVNTVTDIGGIAGTSSGVIRSCENHGSIGYRHMGYNIGGIAGSQAGYITNCTNYGQICGRKEAGGIVGQMEPVTTLEYSIDTLQILQGQLDTLSALTDRASSNAKNNAFNLSGQITILQDQVQTAKDAVEQLIPDAPSSEEEDSTVQEEADRALAAVNTLGECLSGMAGTLRSLAVLIENTTSTLAKDLQAISDQMDAMNETINSASENLGGSVSDISDADTPEDLTGKIENCVNYGAVLADLNAGGIVGAVSLENDLDAEDDLQIFGDTSLNFTGQLRAVILNSVNKATVIAAKQNAGGIVGMQIMGLVKDCLNTGDLDAEGVDYVGGIAGISNGYIRRSYAACKLSGSTNVGGIAGSGMIVTNCMSMVQLITGTEKLGAILGSLEESHYDETTPLFENFYLCVGRDLGGIDGISYSGLAQQLDTDTFLAQPDLPEVFRSSIVTFVFPDGTEQSFSVATGQSLPGANVPKLPQKDGYCASWNDLEAVSTDTVYFDTRVEAVYTPMPSVIQSQTFNESVLPVLLLQGTFLSDAVITLTPADSIPNLEKGHSLVEAWCFTIPESQTQITGRYRLPEGLNASNLRLMVCNADGSWTDVSFITDGSYAVFDMEQSQIQLAVIHVTQPIWIWCLIAGAAASAIAISIPVIHLHSKKKKQ